MRAFEFLNEAKIKGKDGKACWKGYRYAGTKMKGGKRVDNCVPVKEAADKPKVGRALQHAEDLVIVDGSAGAMRAVEELAKMADTVDDVTVKWDGSPAIVFGRDENGQVILTDKSGFDAKGYNGRATSGEELERMFLSRVKTEADDARRAFAANMKKEFLIL